MSDPTITPDTLQIAFKIIGAVIAGVGLFAGGVVVAFKFYQKKSDEAEGLRKQLEDSRKEKDAAVVEEIRKDLRRVENELKMALSSNTKRVMALVAKAEEITSNLGKTSMDLHRVNTELNSYIKVFGTKIYDVEKKVNIAEANNNRLLTELANAKTALMLAKDEMKKSMNDLGKCQLLKVGKDTFIIRKVS